MEIITYVLKWSEAILRWGHVLFAILWVGNSFLFNYLDNKLNKDLKSEEIDGEGYLMHSGFYYKLQRLKTSPNKIFLNQLVIFKTSKGDFEVDKIAKKYFDGGGHNNAAGGISNTTLSKTIKKVELITNKYKNEIKKS